MDNEVGFLIDQPFDVRHTPQRRQHVVVFRLTDPGGVEEAFHPSSIAL